MYDVHEDAKTEIIKRLLRSTLCGLPYICAYVYTVSVGSLQNIIVPHEAIPFGGPSLNYWS
jgi:hypothetical protein